MEWRKNQFQMGRSSIYETWQTIVSNVNNGTRIFIFTLTEWASKRESRCYKLLCVKLCEITQIFKVYNPPSLCCQLDFTSEKRNKEILFVYSWNSQIRKGGAINGQPYLKNCKVYWLLMPHKETPCIEITSFFFHVNFIGRERNHDRKKRAVAFYLGDTQLPFIMFALRKTHFNQ